MRTFVRWFTTVLAAVGWAGAAYSWHSNGHAAGVNPGFLMAMSLGICFTIVAGQWWRMPSMAELKEDQASYALGYREGLSCGACPLRPAPRESEPSSRLSAVR